MSLAGVNPGDIVLVAGCYGYVRAKERRRLLVRWLKTTNEQWVRATEVEAHWRKTRK